MKGCNINFGKVIGVYKNFFSVNAVSESILAAVCFKIVLRKIIDFDLFEFSGGNKSFRKFLCGKIFAFLET